MSTENHKEVLATIVSSRIATILSISSDRVEFSGVEKYHDYDNVLHFRYYIKIFSPKLRKFKRWLFFIDPPHQNSVITANVLNIVLDSLCRWAETHKKDIRR